MNKYKFKFRRLQEEIFRFLCVRVGEKVNQREIAKALDVSAAAVGKALVGLGGVGIVEIEKMGNMNLRLIELNRDSEKVVNMKRVENLRMIYESGMVGFLEEKFAGCVVILFGSYARGEDDARSDIDIAVVGGREKQIDLEKYDEFFEREVRVNFYDSFGDIDKHLRSNIFNGIVLCGMIGHEEI